MNQISGELMQNPAFIKAMQGAIKGKEKVEEAATQALRGMNIPTRTEFKKALSKIEPLERELAVQKAAVEEPQGQGVGGRRRRGPGRRLPGSARPRRSRRPGRAHERRPAGHHGHRLLPGVAPAAPAGGGARRRRRGGARPGDAAPRARRALREARSHRARVRPAPAGGVPRAPGGGGRARGVLHEPAARRDVRARAGVDRHAQPAGRGGGGGREARDDALVHGRLRRAGTEPELPHRGPRAAARVPAALAARQAGGRGPRGRRSRSATRTSA